MGKTGTYKKKNPLTGTEKKQAKIGAKEYRQAKGQRKEALKLQQTYATGTDPLSQQIRENFGVGGKAYTSTEGLEQAKAIYDPIRQEARRGFTQETLPDVMNIFGRGSKASSALNQALGAAAQDLETRLSAQLTDRYAEERQRAQAMQYNQLQSQYANQYNAALNQQQAGIPGANIANAKEQSVYVPKGTPVATSAFLAGTESAAAAVGKKGGQQYSAPNTTAANTGGSQATTTPPPV